MALGDPRGVIIAAPRSGSGKTVLTLGLLAALRAAGTNVAAAKTGPDYIDAAILGHTAGTPAVNLDPWAMPPDRLKHLASTAAHGSDLLVVEGVMGLFDGAADGQGSTADLAAALGLPVVLVVDAERQSQSVAALVSGFARWRDDVNVAAVILNRVATTRHERMLMRALAATGIECLGAIPRRTGLALPERHLGLVLPAEIAHFDSVVADAGGIVTDHLDLSRVQAIALALPKPEDAVSGLAPLGQRIAIATDGAFAFVYPHLLEDWRRAGAELMPFSPLADEAPDSSADAVFLPGGYPELHGATLAAASTFKAGLAATQARGALIYGECGGFMALGEALIDKAGIPHQMAGLLPVVTRIDRPRRTLGYRVLNHDSPLVWPPALRGHEFHYSSVEAFGGDPLFGASDAEGTQLPPMGTVVGRVMGSYAHVIDRASQ
ncbi:cobyrinic acid a,c-diamide synthase [Devosia pacifica]|uniref:Hydrogenobyrinate a,c-diamide synthase n=1 Tax=Devosia pacifica TaxID=1335967 RepID=A0A918SBH9_9HYPH|nr:cobyrinate a,c-diamide synthase [Devosia pacifica]GHA30794.1 cobyrinic acid a,c-diamide synthase [Devosia pacifica]